MKALPTRKIQILSITLIATMLSMLTATAQESVYQFILHPESRGHKVKDITYHLDINDGEETFDITEKKGKFQFTIQAIDENIVLTIEKSGFITKEIIMNPQTYPFEFDYEIQHLDIEMVPVSEELPVSYAGELKYDILNGGFYMQKDGGDIDALKAELKGSQEKLKEIYDIAIKNADGLAAIEEYEYAKYFYDLALNIYPEQSYPAKRTSEMDVLAAEKKEQEALMADEVQMPEEQVEEMAREMANKMFEERMASPGQEVVNPNTSYTNNTSNYNSNDMDASDFSGGNISGTYYSVQIGAFKGPINQSVFASVPGFRVVQNPNWKRAFSGEFASKSEARARQSMLANQGFSDCFIVRMKGNNRLNF